MQVSSALSKRLVPQDRPAREPENDRIQGCSLRETGEGCARRGEGGEGFSPQDAEGAERRARGKARSLQQGFTPLRIPSPLRALLPEKQHAALAARIYVVAPRNNFAQAALTA